MILQQIRRCVLTLTTSGWILCILLAMSAEAQSCLVSGASQVCENTMEGYSTSYAETMHTTYAWSLSGGGAIIGDHTLDTVTVSWSFRGFSMCSVISTKKGSTKRHAICP
jgi:hypothetical protein